MAENEINLEEQLDPDGESVLSWMLNCRQESIKILGDNYKDQSMA